MMSAETVVGLLTALGILYIAWRDRNSAGDSLVQSAMAMLEKHEERVAQLEKRDQERERQLKTLITELDWYKYGVSLLIRQMRDLKIEPKWTPDSPRDKRKA